MRGKEGDKLFFSVLNVVSFSSCSQRTARKQFKRLYLSSILFSLIPSVTGDVLFNPLLVFSVQMRYSSLKSPSLPGGWDSRWWAGHLVKWTSPPTNRHLPWWNAIQRATIPNPPGSVHCPLAICSPRPQGLFWLCMLTYEISSESPVPTLVLIFIFKISS